MHLGLCGIEFGGSYKGSQFSSFVCALKIYNLLCCFVVL